MSRCSVIHSHACILNIIRAPIQKQNYLYCVQTKRVYFNKEHQGSQLSYSFLFTFNKQVSCSYHLQCSGSLSNLDQQIQYLPNLFQTFHHISIISKHNQTRFCYSQMQGWVSPRKKGISSFPMGGNGFLPGRKPFFWEEIGKRRPRDTII